MVVASIGKNGDLNLEGYIDTPGHSFALSIIPNRNILVLLSLEYELGVKESERGTISIYGLPVASQGR